MLSSFAEKIKKWYRGRYIPPPQNDPGDSVVIIGPGRYEQPLAAKIIKWFAEFWMAHWTWIITTIIMLIGLIVAILKIRTH